MRWTVVLAVLAVAFAGCVGSGSSGTDAAPAGGNGTPVQDPGSGGAPDRVAASFPLQGPVNRTAWANGTVAPQQTSSTGACLRDACENVTDVTELIPVGVPTRLHLELRYEPGAESTVFGPDITAWIQGQDTTYTYNWSNPEDGTIAVDARVTVREGSSVTVHVVGFRPTVSDDPNLNYTLAIQATASPTVVPAGVPVAVPLEPGTRLRASAVDPDGRAAMRIHDPEDRHLADVAGADAAGVPIPDDAPAGSYVVTPRSDAGAVELTVRGSSSPTLHPLALETTASEPTTYNGTGEASWSFSVEDHPLRVGAYVQGSWSGTPAGFGPWTVVDGLEMTVARPDGSATSATWCSSICFSIGNVGGAAETPVADASLTPGTYEGTISARAAAPFDYGHFVVRYAR